MKLGEISKRRKTHQGQTHNLGIFYVNLLNGKARMVVTGWFENLVELLWAPRGFGPNKAESHPIKEAKILPTIGPSVDFCITHTLAVRHADFDCFFLPDVAPSPDFHLF